MLVSIIVPVYNVAPYLRRCLDSIINQTYSQLEIILVDDGSTDDSGDICDEYSRKDNRIKIIHKPNGGISSARNTGLEVAKGEYIAFVDSDDWLDLHMYESLIAAFQAFPDADLVTCGIIKEYDDKNIQTANNSGEIVVRQEASVYRDLFDGEKNIRFEVWNKLFKNKIINELRFVEGQIFEEVNFDFYVIRRSKCVVTLDMSLYHYRMQRPGNTISSFKWNKFSIFAELYKYIIYFRQQQWTDLVNQYALYAGETAISHYLNAVSCRAADDMASECLNWALFFNRVAHKPSFKLRLFCKSPRIYATLRRLLKR